VIMYFLTVIYIFSLRNRSKVCDWKLFLWFPPLRFLYNIGKKLRNPGLQLQKKKLKRFFDFAENWKIRCVWPPTPPLPRGTLRNPDYEYNEQIIYTKNFKALHSLYWIYLFSQKAISNLKNVSHILLMYNQLLSIPSNAFKTLTNSEEIYLFSNHIKHIARHAFAFGEKSKKILEIWLEFNNLNESSFESGSFSGKSEESYSIVDT
jgi:hypothetical protein